MMVSPERLTPSKIGLRIERLFVLVNVVVMKYVPAGPLEVGVLLRKVFGFEANDTRPFPISEGMAAKPKPPMSQPVKKKWVLTESAWGQFSYAVIFGKGIGSQ